MPPPFRLLVGDPIHPGNNITVRISPIWKKQFSSADAEALRAVRKDVFITRSSDGGVMGRFRGDGAELHLLNIDPTDEGLLDVRCECSTFRKSGRCVHILSALTQGEEKGWFRGTEPLVDAIESKSRVRDEDDDIERDDEEEDEDQGYQASDWSDRFETLVRTLRARHGYKHRSVTYERRYLLSLRAAPDSNSINLRVVRRRLSAMERGYEPLSFELDWMDDAFGEEATALRYMFGSREREEMRASKSSVSLPSVLAEPVLAALARADLLSYQIDETEKDFAGIPKARDAAGMHSLAAPMGEMSLRLSSIANGQQVELLPELTLRRPDSDQSEVVALDSVVYAHPAGYVVRDHELHRIDPKQVPWIHLFLRDEERSMPKAAAKALVKAAAMSKLQVDADDDAVRVVTQDGTPAPVVSLLDERDREIFGRWRDDERVVFQVLYRYGTELIQKSLPQDVVFDEASGVSFVRSLEKEALFEQGLVANGVKVHEQGGDEYDAVYSFLRSQWNSLLPMWLSSGIKVLDHGQPYALSADLRLRMDGGIDWFDVKGEIDFGNGRTAPLPDVLAAIRDKKNFVKLEGGDTGLLTDEVVKQLAWVSLLANDKGRIDKAFAPHLAAAGVMEKVELSEAVRDALSTRVMDKADPKDPRGDFDGTLRSYQKEGLGWMWRLHEIGMSGCLADEMGLGKTVQVIALLSHVYQVDSKKEETAKKPTLIVLPRSLLFNWESEAKRFLPHLRLGRYVGGTRTLDVFSENDVIFTTYGLLRQDVDVLAKVEFEYVILDEAQAIKNARSQVALSAKRLVAKHRLALSGTPVENRLADLASLFEFLEPSLGKTRLLRALRKDRSQVEDISEQPPGGPDSIVSSALSGDEREVVRIARATLSPFLLRRTKKEVESELPDRIEQIAYCELSDEERAEYEEVRSYYRSMLANGGAALSSYDEVQTADEAALAKTRGKTGGRSTMNVLEGLLRLRQLALHPALLDKKRHGESSAKLDLLFELMGGVLEQGAKCLVFSQFLGALDLVGERLNKMGVKYTRLDGQSSDRAAVVETFQKDDETRVLLATLKVGGVGLNLTAAEYVFLLDPWWNPAAEAQAIDRAHRIGQTKKVIAYRLVSKDTVEEKVLALEERKRAIAGALFDREQVSMKKEDLEFLLG